jgi:hypothetical protein
MGGTPTHCAAPHVRHLTRLEKLNKKTTFKKISSQRLAKLSAILLLKYLPHLAPQLISPC